MKADKSILKSIKQFTRDSEATKAQNRCKFIDLPRQSQHERNQFPHNSSPAGLKTFNSNLTNHNDQLNQAKVGYLSLPKLTLENGRVRSGCLRKTAEGREDTEMDQGKSGKSIKFDPNQPCVYHYQLNNKPSQISIKLTESVVMVPVPVQSPCCEIY